MDLLNPPSYSSGDEMSTSSSPVPVLTEPEELLDLGSMPSLTYCEHCHEKAITEVSYHTGRITWVVCGVVALMGGILGCCLIPFCVNNCKDVVHRCPQCTEIIGVHRRM
ncbi:Lipopolysaccharide-induced tumor necrosis factor-alpha factor [Fasciolopsis buskii]|uniref:Lipopolysaccharide-induced tumor necrosis factor-alpha factor n=1 Tax=Fasciolopsis buskii TaxID=27845 RepID=A0A8E0VJ76_9TREM|nr:Lipopolysaccharide-induced tumor necrosis factor-alpha factor [Fasciolopsis buski]